MRHDWREYFDPSKSSAENFISEPMRRCCNCGIIQQRARLTWYMRTTGYLWRPLAGRCWPPEQGVQGITTIQEQLKS